MSAMIKFHRNEDKHPKDLISLGFKPIGTISELAGQFTNWQVWEEDEGFIVYDTRRKKVIISQIDKSIVDFLNCDLTKVPHEEIP